VRPRIYRLKLGQWPDWSPLARGWWNPAEHPTGWAGLDRTLDAVAGSNVVELSLPILMAFGAYVRLEEWYNRRVLILHTIGGRPRQDAGSQ